MEKKHEQAASRLPERGPGRPKGVKVVQVPVALQHMRKVYKSEKPRLAGEEYKAFPDDTAGMATYRALYRENLKEFLSQMQKAEAEYRKRVDELKRESEKGKAAETERDAGAVKLTEMIDRLLTEWGGSDVK